MKSYYYLILLLLFSCGDNSENQLQTIESNPKGEPVEFYGNTQGTTYAVICNDSILLEHQEIDDLLKNFDNALSTYIESSTITQLNNAGAGSFLYTDPFSYFNRCYLLAQSIYQQTDGAFDPTIYPLVDGWGFLKDESFVPDSATVDSLRTLLGFSNGYHFTFNQQQATNDSIKNYELLKNTPGAKLDFNAIAQGFGCGCYSPK